MQKAAQTSQSLSQDLVISHNDNHNILQTCVSNWPFKYISEKNKSIILSQSQWENMREMLIPGHKEVSVSVGLLLFDVLAKNSKLKVASCFLYNNSNVFDLYFASSHKVLRLVLPVLLPTLA